MEPKEFKSPAQSNLAVEDTVGKPNYKLTGGEKEQIRYRPSPNVVKDMKRVGPTMPTLFFA
jgi:hypothetical protein